MHASLMVRNECCDLYSSASKLHVLKQNKTKKNNSPNFILDCLCFSHTFVDGNVELLLYFQ